MLKKHSNLLITIIVSAILFQGCAAIPFSGNRTPFTITKVNTYPNLTSLNIGDQSFAESYGLDRFLRADETLPAERKGEIVRATWKYTGRELKQNITFQFRYKTSKEPDIKKIEKTYPSLKKGTYHYTFEHLGNTFINEGPIAIWQVVILEEGETVAAKQSRLWNIVTQKKLS